MPLILKSELSEVIVIKLDKIYRPSIANLSENGISIYKKGLIRGKVTNVQNMVSLLNP